MRAKETSRKIVVDVNAVKGPRDECAGLCVGSGHASLALRKGYIEQLAEARRECGFRYVRFHGILHDDMAVYAESDAGVPRMNWQYVDLVYDAICGLGMKPFVELSFMPAALASGDRTVFWWRANVTPPKDYAKWRALIGSFATHLKERYGRKEVADWYFEVWNEPNNKRFFAGDKAEYFHMYDEAAAAIKAVCPDFRVGGPATAGNAWVPDLIAHCSELNVPLDFITTHPYGIRVDPDTSGDSENDGFIVEHVRTVHEQIAASALPGLPVHCAEWSASRSNRDRVHDSTISAAYVLEMLKGVEGFVASMSYRTFSDIVEEEGPPLTPFHGGSGLMNVQGLKKPAFFAYKFLNMLGPIELACEDTRAWACRGDKAVQILFWNVTRPESIEQATVARPAREVGNVVVTVTGLPRGAVTFTVYRVGYHCNDVASAYVDMGAPCSLTKRQVRQLDDEHGGLPVFGEEIVVGEAGTLSRPFTMKENDVYFVNVQPSG